MIEILFLPATKSRLERELAEAVQEDENSVEAGAAQSGEVDPGSDSDSDCGEGPYPFAPSQPPLQPVNSLEASMWSLDISASSSMETSGYSDTEVLLYQ